MWYFTPDKSKFAFTLLKVFIHQRVPAVRELMHVSCSIDLIWPILQRLCRVRARSPAFRHTAVLSAFEEKKLLFLSCLVECRLQKTNYSYSNPLNTRVVQQREAEVFHSRHVFDEVPCPLQLLSRLWENSLCGRRTEQCNEKGQSPYLGHILISLLISKIWLCCSFSCSDLDLHIPCHSWNDHSWMLGLMFATVTAAEMGGSYQGTAWRKLQLPQSSAKSKGCGAAIQLLFTTINWFWVRPFVSLP